MASDQKKLNPNATPYLIFPHRDFDHRPPLQILTVPYYSMFYYQSALPFGGYPFYASPLHFNLNTHSNNFVTSNSGNDGLERVCEEFTSNEPKKAKKKSKVGYQAPRFRCSKGELGSGGAKEQLWLPKSLNGVEETKLIKEVRADFNGKTSLMIRNIPNQLQRQDLLQILDNHCLEVNVLDNHCLEVNGKEAKVKSAYDFLYLPMDFNTGGNYGYAFVNFTNSIGALRFYKAFNKHQWDVPLNKKTCQICCATIQGKAAFTNHFKNSLFQCKTSEYLPVVLSPPRDGRACSRVIVVGRHWEEGRRNSSQSEKSDQTMP